MNYFKARQIADGSGWRYTVRNGDYIVATAGCADTLHVHATAEDAERCAAEWVVATARLDVTVATNTSVHRCSLPSCDNLIATDGPNAAMLGVGMASIHPLCPDHLNAGGVRALVGDRLGEVMSS